MTSKDLMIELRLVRIRKGISQHKLSQMIGVSRATIMNWESGAFTPSIEDFLSLCRALGVKISIKEKSNG